MSFDVDDEILRFLKTGGYKGTRVIHLHLKEKGLKICRKRLLAWLHTYAEPGGFDSIGGVRQKTWVM